MVSSSAEARAACGSDLQRQVKAAWEQAHKWKQEAAELQVRRAAAARDCEPGCGTGDGCALTRGRIFAGTAGRERVERPVVAAARPGREQGGHTARACAARFQPPRARLRATSHARRGIRGTRALAGGVRIQG